MISVGREVRVLDASEFEGIEPDDPTTMGSEGKVVENYDDMSLVDFGNGYKWYVSDSKLEVIG